MAPVTAVPLTSPTHRPPSQNFRDSLGFIWMVYIMKTVKGAFKHHFVINQSDRNISNYLIIYIFDRLFMHLYHFVAEISAISLGTRSCSY